MLSFKELPDMRAGDYFQFTVGIFGRLQTQYVMEVVMSFLNSYQNPTRTELLMAFCDINGFMRFSQTMEDEQVFQVMNQFWKDNCSVLEIANAHIVKYMGDAIFVVFEAENAQRGTLALLEFKRNCDLWLKEYVGKGCEMIVKVHFGEVVAGPVGTDKFNFPDVMGKQVNQCAILKSTGFAMTAQVFRKLDKEARQCFKKHTPLVTYIPTDAKRPNN
jgi:class 3 adenylate cyclase